MKAEKEVERVNEELGYKRIVKEEGGGLRRE